MTMWAQELAACVAETIEVQLVPWSCSFDDSEKTLKGKEDTTVTCMPAYLQVTKTPGAFPSVHLW